MRLRAPGALDSYGGLVVLALGVVEVVSGQLDTGPSWVAWASVAVYAGVLLLRRTSLWMAVVVCFATVVVTYALGLSQEDYLASITTCLVMVWFVGYTWERAESLLGLAYCFGCVAATNDPGPTNLAWLVLVIGGAWLAGRVLRSRRLLIENLRETTAELERSREELASRAVADERLRIARDIHDIVAHSVTVMLVQAEAAERVLSEQSDARQAIAAVQDSGRQAIAELRHLLGVLRVDGAKVGTSPQPGLTDLAGLVAGCADAGLTVTGPEVDGSDPRSSGGVPAPVALTAFRVAQEALTNVLRHSEAREATLAVVREGEALVVEVADGGPARPGPVRPGHGLVGMRERVMACGGDLSAGPDGRGFRVRARLPLGVGG